MTQCSNSRDEFCLRVITEARHILKDNPVLAALEEIGKKDPDYCRILNFVQTKCSFKELPSKSDGSTMRGEWPLLSILPEFEILVLNEANIISKFSHQSNIDP